MSWKFIACIFSVLIYSTSAMALPTDDADCPFKTINKSVVIKLTGRKDSNFFKLKSSVEFGRFEIQNHGTSTVVLRGTLYGNDFYIFQPRVVVQSFGTDLNWHAEGVLPGDYEIPPDKLELQQNSKKSFITQIHFPKLLNSTGLLRLIMFNSESKSCFLSEPFHENASEDTR